MKECVLTWGDLALGLKMRAARSETAQILISDAPDCSRHITENTGSALLQAALTRENLQKTFKRVRADKGAAGVDGLDIDQTARALVHTWPVIRQQILQRTYRPSPVRRVAIPKPDGGELDAVNRRIWFPKLSDKKLKP